MVMRMQPWRDAFQEAGHGDMAALAARRPPCSVYRYHETSRGARVHGAAEELDPADAKSMRGILLVLATATAAAPDGAFRTRWDGRRAVAVESLANTALPTHCDLAVVGAGWGGAYLCSPSSSASSSRRTSAASAASVSSAASRRLRSAFLSCQL